ncbi:PaaI family thioesterase [Sulfitobacter sp. M57]|uniref:PaaI family thioesterase n=1 Tax=unclassified Sulfitobacter TaxID=196795 RepID=UPI0023E09B5C|nr:MULTISPECIES: PaaI family thioesterase [unclassified Sulfitobacter]MDF3413664.1 PaaI family thioesterase [Sulfitobacter sp. KE5]MDF3421055.1 PaaI family thioesterase [Sulfitobacter sp. KE43]MDF3432210.1 PaaI family thioesterase [Sulfitobacter sp. KE42]MDF3457849.1 PaaI family thioesterase [Sulfitobacter sp. S74]MDF3461750.1 PaaI family thioesterase [Sulfitobacter sp. Ks18]
MAAVMTVQQLNDFLGQVFEQVADDFCVDEVEGDTVTMRLLTSDKHLRPGGTISGPSMFGLADVAAYVVTLAHIGPKALAVTTNCSIDFMRKPEAGVPLIAKARLLKLGKQLSVTDVLLFSEGLDAPVARASLTYAIPPKSMG